MLEQAPAGATCIVFHSAGLAHVDEGMSAQFADLMRAFDVYLGGERGIGVVLGRSALSIGDP